MTIRRYGDFDQKEKWLINKKLQLIFNQLQFFISL